MNQLVRIFRVGRIARRGDCPARGFIVPLPDDRFIAGIARKQVGMIGDAFRPTAIGPEKARHGRKGHAVVALLRFAAVNGPGPACELHPKSWTRKSTKGVQKSMGKELFSEELKLAVVQYVLEGHTRKEASEKFCVSCTPIEKWVNLYKLHGAKGLLSRNLVGRQKGFDGEFRLKVLQYKQEHHLSCTQTAMHFCLDVVTVCRWEKKFQKEGAQGLMKKQATKGSEKRQKKQEQSELQQENKRLSEENYRLKMENDYLKKLNALIQKREKPE